MRYRKKIFYARTDRTFGVPRYPAASVLTSPAGPQPLEEHEDDGSAGWRRRWSTSCSRRLGLRAALRGQRAVMLAASARRLSAAASFSSSSMRSSQLAAVLNQQVRRVNWDVGGSHMMIAMFYSSGAGDELKS